MIKARLMGGLGNQMFEYAVGRNLAVKHGTNLKVIFDHPPAYSVRNYQLGCFQLAPDLRVEITRDYPKFLSIIRQAFSSREKVIKEKSFAYDPDILNTPDETLLDGFFQSEKYFQDIKDIIRSDFTFKNKLTGKNRFVAGKIKESNSISLHIRRGDYVKDKTTNAFHGTAGLDYYFRGASYLKDKVDSPKYFIFSDDINWAKDNLKLPDVTFIDWNTGDKDYIDMQLMSLCKHNIIANSSFSWWGAWLNSNPKKIVITPKQWFADTTVDTKDLIPNTWVKL